MISKIYSYLIAIGLVILIWSAVGYVVVKVYDEYFEVKNIIDTLEQFTDSHETRLSKLERVFIEDGANLSINKAKRLGSKKNVKRNPKRDKKVAEQKN